MTIKRAKYSHCYFVGVLIDSFIINLLIKSKYVCLRTRDFPMCAGQGLGSMIPPAKPISRSRSFGGFGCSGGYVRSENPAKLPSPHGVGEKGTASHAKK